MANANVRGDTVRDRNLTAIHHLIGVDGSEDDLADATASDSIAEFLNKLYLGSASEANADLPPIDRSMWNKIGELVKRKTKLFEASAAESTLYNLSSPQVIVNGVSIPNLNFTSRWLGEYRTEESRPPASGNNNQFLLNGHTGTFQRSNSNDWVEYNPFASGQPWNNVYPYGAYVDLTFSAGDHSGDGIRITITGKHANQIGTNGNDWTISVSHSSITSLFHQVGTTAFTLFVDTSDPASSIPEILGRINQASFTDVEIQATYIGDIDTTTVADSNFASGAHNFANGSEGTAGVNLSHLDSISDNLEDLNNHLTSSGVAAYNSADRSVYGVAAFTPGEAAHQEHTDAIYRQPGFWQVVDITDGGRPAPSPGTRGKFFVDHRHGTVSFDYVEQIARTDAEGTGTAYSHANFLGVATSDPVTTHAHRLYYNKHSHHWRYSSIEPYTARLSWNTVHSFRNLNSIAGLASDRDFIPGEFNTADAAAQAITDYSASTRYYYYNADADDIEYLTDYTAPVDPHDVWHTLRFLTDRDIDPSENQQQSDDQDDITFTGSSWASWQSFQYSDTAPTANDVPTMFTDGSVDYSGFSMRPTKAQAEQSGDTSDTLWIAFSSAYRSANGTWVNNVVSIVAEHDTSFSSEDDPDVNTEADWHETRVDADIWMRNRDNDGAWILVPIRNPNAGNRVWLRNTRGEIRVTNVNDTVNHPFTTVVNDINRFDFIGFEVTRHNGYGGQNNLGLSHETILARPANGWHVENDTRKFEFIYRNGYGLSVTTENVGGTNTPITLPSNFGSYNEMGAIIAFKGEFKGTLTDGVQSVTSIELSGFRGTYGYAGLRIFGIIV